MKKMESGFVCLFIMLLAISCSGRKGPEKQPGEEEINRKLVQTYVYDQFDTFNASQLRSLNTKLTNLHTNDSIVVKCIVVGSYSPFEDEMEYGKYFLYLNRDNDDVLMFLIAFLGDRKVALITNETAKTIYPDSTCQSILNNRVIPKLKEGALYESFNSAIDTIKMIGSKGV